MATYSQIIEGLKILMAIEGDKHNICAEHDVIYAGPDSDGITPEEEDKLKALGWSRASEGGWKHFV